tara:strand:+ start:1054 stop:1266 length:213 start_codon:yes stop_codon:yes gene_type:complete
MVYKSCFNLINHCTAQTRFRKHLPFYCHTISPASNDIKKPLDALSQKKPAKALAINIVALWGIKIANNVL